MKRDGDHARVLLVGYEEHDNLGLRTLQAILEGRGVSVGLVPFTPGSHNAVIAAAMRARPALMGFSVLFQYSLDDFAALAAALRRAGLRSHFTAGGHYPSLRPEEILRAVPALDTVVRCEGELTLPELVESLDSPDRWPQIKGLAFRRGQEIVLTHPRPLVSDLDNLPWPVRGAPRMLTPDIRLAPMLASRGCLYDCTFCSIREFYHGAPGPARRVRSPASVVAEMRMLYDLQRVRLFVFEDDDFASRSPSQRLWVEAFLDEMRVQGLRGRAVWLAACRVDEVDQTLLERCMESGLIALFLGVESGNEAGLRALGKRVSVRQNLKAIETVKALGLYFDMGFMLLDPESTIETVHANLRFLHEAAGDGSTAIPLVRTIPYAGTRIERQLRREGRLVGTPSRPNYGFRDPKLDLFAAFAFDTLQGHAVTAGSLTDQLWLARMDYLVRRALMPSPAPKAYGRSIVGLTARANRSLLETLGTALSFVENRDEGDILRDWHLLDAPAHIARLDRQRIGVELQQLLRRHSPSLLGRINSPLS